MVPTHYLFLEVGTETCEVDTVFPPDDLWFGSDIYTNVQFYIICI